MSIVEELKKISQDLGFYKNTGFGYMVSMAADEIERLTRQRDELRETLSDILEDLDGDGCIQPKSILHQRINAQMKALERCK